MKKEEAIKLRDDNREKLIGKPLDGDKDGWDIQDVIIGDTANVGSIYTKMWDDNITNELAVSFFTIKDEEYDTFIVSHQWSWGSGDLFTQKIQNYYNTKPA